MLEGAPRYPQLRSAVAATEFVDAAGRTLVKGDLVRLVGYGRKAFRIRHHAKTAAGAEWIDMYGPIDERRGTPTKDSRYLSVPIDGIAAKVRTS
jgi:hypothetical protein